MPAPRRFLLGSLLLIGLTAGCRSKPAPEPENSNKASLKSIKIKKMQEQPEGPSLRP